MFLFCLVFAMFCARLFICAFWSPAGKGLTSWLSFVVSSVSLSLSHWYPGSGVVLDCIDSWSLHHYLLLTLKLSREWLTKTMSGAQDDLHLCCFCMLQNQIFSRQGTYFTWSLRCHAKLFSFSALCFVIVKLRLNYISYITIIKELSGNERSEWTT